MLALRPLCLGLIALGLPALAAPGPGARHGGPPHVRPAPTAPAVPGEDEVQDLRRSLDRLRAIASQIRNEVLADQIRREVAAAERDLARLDGARWLLIDTAATLEADALRCERQLDRVRPPRPAPQPYPEAWYPEPDPGPLPATPAEVATIRRAVDDTAFSQEKLAVLRSAATDRWFTAAQVVSLLDAFDFEKDKVEAAALLHAHVIDPANWFQVYGAFDFDSSKRSLRERVGQ